MVEAHCGAGTTSGTVLGQPMKGNCRLEGAARIAGNCSCGYEIVGCKKLPAGCLGKSHEVMLDGKIHPGVSQAAVT